MHARTIRWARRSRPSRGRERAQISFKTKTTRPTIASLRVLPGSTSSKSTGKKHVEGTKDEALFLQVDIAKKQAALQMHSEQRSPAGTIGDGQVVVAIDDGQRFRLDHGIHGQSLCARNADGHKSLPGQTGARGARTDRLERAAGQGQ